MSEITEEQKAEIIKEAMFETGKYLLTLFKTLDLEWGMEQMFIDQTDNNKEYVLSFKTIDKHLKDRNNL